MYLQVYIVQGAYDQRPEFGDLQSASEEAAGGVEAYEQREQSAS